jgi:threonine aldolase
MHLDGARLWNAIVATGIPALEWCRHFDSVSVCFSKGLGAPVGSALVGSRELIARAKRVRKMAGGGMRQAGLLAAAASYALDHHVARLSDDHANARRLAAGLAGIEGLTFTPPASNILFVDLAPALVQARTAAKWGGEHDSLVEQLRSRGVLCTGLYKLRFVTHLDVDAAAVDRAAAEIRAALGARS